MTTTTTMTAAARNKAKRLVNNHLVDMCKEYTDGLPIQDVIDVLHAAGFTETDELVGVYCGRDGRVHEHVGDGVYLVLSWHKMEVSGRYEIVAYVS